MNKQDLELAKQIAVIEGVELTSHRGLLWCKGKGDLYIDGVVYKEYNPFDWSILGPLMFKYNVMPDYNFNSCDCVDYEKQTSFSVDFDGTEESMKRAILQCIVKSQGA